MEALAWTIKLKRKTTKNVLKISAKTANGGDSDECDHTISTQEDDSFAGYWVRNYASKIFLNPFIQLHSVCKTISKNPWEY